ncbi:chorismate mutase [Clostridium sp. CCUG 7971]
MKVLAIRGATTVEANNKEQILKQSAILVERIIEKMN